MKANKNFLNKLRTALLNASKNGTPKMRSEAFFDSILGGQNLRLFYKYNISDIKFVEEREKVFALAFLKYEFISLKDYYRSDKEDTALCCISYKLNYYVDWARMNGFPDGANTPDDVILKSNAYKIIRKELDAFESSEISITLNSKVYPTLKVRDGVIPLAVFNPKDDSLNYPYRRLYSSSLMSSTVRNTRNKVEVIRDLKHVASCCMENTPFGRWIVMKSSYPHVALSGGSL